MDESAGGRVMMRLAHASCGPNQSRVLSSARNARAGISIVWVLILAASAVHALIKTDRASKESATSARVSVCITPSLLPSQ